MNRNIYSHKQILDNLFEKVRQLDPSQQSEWSKYLCVLTAGFIEESLRVLLFEYAKQKSAPKIQRFVEKKVKYITNCKTEKIIEVLTDFDVDWAETFQTRINDESPIDKEIKDSLDSIIATRHLIAHGKRTGIGYVTVKNYYKYCLKAVTILEDIIQ